MVSILAAGRIYSGNGRLHFRHTTPFLFLFFMSMELGAGKFGSLVLGLLAGDTIIAIADCVSR